MSPRQRSAGQPRPAQSNPRPSVQPRLVRPVLPPTPQNPEPIDRDAPCYVQLGRFGDIVNLLPILRDVWKRTGVKPYVVVARRYASIFDGVSYVRPVMFGDDWGDVLPAMEWAKRLWTNPVLTQVKGHGWEVKHECATWNLEQHRLAGFPEGFHEDDFPHLVFDLRDYARERRLIDRIIPVSEKPLMLLNLSGGVSSPLSNHAEIQGRIVKEWGSSFSIVDVAKVTADRVYDLIGVCEIADLLITSDSSLLHLAEATGVRTISFLSDRGEWLMSNVYGAAYHVWSGKGSSVLDRWAEVTEEIHECYDLSGMAVFHTFEEHAPKDARTQRAQYEWDFNLSEWDRLPYSEYARDARAIGDTRNLPYLRDVLQYWLNEDSKTRVPDGNLLVFSNSDVWFHPDIDRRIRNKMKRLVMATGRRIDVPTLSSRSPDSGGAHCGRDIVVWRTEWLRRNLWSIPDFILGASLWDYWASGQARVLAGGTWDWHQDTQDHYSEIEPGAVLHEIHKPVWETGANTFPSQIHNRRLYKEWLKNLGQQDEL